MSKRRKRIGKGESSCYTLWEGSHQQCRTNYLNWSHSHTLAHTHTHGPDDENRARPRDTPRLRGRRCLARSGVAAHPWPGSRRQPAALGALLRPGFAQALPQLPASPAGRGLTEGGRERSNEALIRQTRYQGFPLDRLHPAATLGSARGRPGRRPPKAGRKYGKCVQSWQSAAPRSTPLAWQPGELQRWRGWKFAGSKTRKMR